MNIAARQIDGASQAASLRFENIAHGYDHRDVIRDISLTAHPGDVLCLLGPSGSGKSTLLRIAAGLEIPRSGRLLIDDLEVSGPSVFLPPEQRGIGLMFQDFALFPHMTVAANVAFGLSRIARAERQRVVEEALERVGLAGYGGKYPHMLSGGEQQRVALARAVAPRPSVLLMDEPFSGLDSRLKDRVRSDTLSVLRETGATVIIVTHDPEEAMGMADQIALLQNGELVQSGTPQSLFRQPANLFAASFFSEINVLDASFHNGLLDTPLGKKAVSASQADGPVTIAVRYSDVRLSPSGTEKSISARVLERRYLGKSEHLVIRLDKGGEVLHASIAAGQLGEQTDQVFVEVAADTILVFEKRP